MLDGVANILEIVVSIVTINGLIYGVFHKFVKKPVMAKYNYLVDTLQSTNIIAKEVQQAMSEKVVPFMHSFGDEFSTNSGKSIKDRITRIDNALKREELRNKLLADSLLTIGAYECDAEGDCVWANRTLCEMFGMSFSDMLGNGWLSAICEPDRKRVWKDWLENIQLDIPYDSVYNVCNVESGEQYSCRSHAIAHRDIKGNILGYYGTVCKIH